MAKIIGLPKLSPTMEEGTLAQWVKSEGDEIEIDDLLAEVETDKATMEFRSFDRGVLLKILVDEGATLAPDEPVAIIGQKGEDITALLEEVAARQKGGGASAPEAAPSEPQADPKPASSAAASSASASSAGASSAPATSAATTGGTPGGRILASPLVRRLARERGLELGGLTGSGPHGRIVKRDLESLPTASAGARRTGERLPPKVVKASPMRKTIARRLTESKQNVPHFYLTVDVDAAPLVAARAMMNDVLKRGLGRDEKPEKVSFNDIVLKACAVALRRIPEVNASWMETEIHFHQVVDISVAVSVPDGLVTPVVRDADQKGVLDIGREVRELAGRARDKKLKLEEMQNGTFSVSNLGMYGIEEFAAVINPPEGALLAVGALRDAVVVEDGQVVAGKRMKLTLSCDHRVVDGALGARWLAELQALLESPMSMLL